jgi:hypothetical protein
MNTYKRLSAVAPFHPVSRRNIDPRGKTEQNSTRTAQFGSKKSRNEDGKKQEKPAVITFFSVSIFPSLVRL